MRKIISPIQDGGLPIDSDDLLSQQELAAVPLQQTLRGISTAMVLSGCDVQNLDVPNSYVIVNPGYVFLNGEVLHFPGYTGGYPFYIVEDTIVTEQRVFEDGFTKNAFEIRKAKAVTSGPTGNYITCSPTPDQTLRTAFFYPTVASGQNLNDLRQSGTFMGTGFANKPDADIDWYYVTVKRHDAAYVSQIAESLTGSRPGMFWRVRTEGIWRPWVKLDQNSMVIANPNFNTYTQAGKYFCHGVLTNGPINAYGHLTVQNAFVGRDLVSQTYHTYANETFTRFYDATIGTWGSWTKLLNTAHYNELYNYIKTEDDWTEINENNGGKCRRDNAGWIHLKSINMNSIGWTTFTLPVGFRPSKVERFTVPCRVVATFSGDQYHYSDFAHFFIGTDGVLTWEGLDYYEYGGGETVNWFTKINGCFFKGA